MDDIKPQGVFGAPNQPDLQVKSPIVSTRKRKFYKQRWFKVVAVLVVLAGLGGWAWYANAAEVTVVLKTKEEDFTHEFTVNGDPAADIEAGQNIIPGETLEKTVKDSRQFPSSGSVTSGNKAAGNVSFYNSCGTQQVIAVNTQAAWTGSSTTRYFRTSAQVTFAGLETKSMNLVAEQIGEESNVSGSTDWHVTGNSCINGDGTATGGTTGGTKVTKKSPSQTDVNNATTTVTNDLLDKTKKSWVDEVEDGNIFINELVYVAKQTNTPTPAVGAEGDNFTMEVTLELKVLVFTDEVLNELLANKLDVGEDKKVDEIIDPTFVVLVFDKEKSTAKLTAKGKAVVVSDYTEDELRDLAAGKNSNNIVKELRGKDGVANVTVKSKPGFLNLLPKRREKITIIFEKSKDFRRKSLTLSEAPECAYALLPPRMGLEFFKRQPFSPRTKSSSRVDK